MVDGVQKAIREARDGVVRERSDGDRLALGVARGRSSLASEVDFASWWTAISSLGFVAVWDRAVGECPDISGVAIGHAAGQRSAIQVFAERTWARVDGHSQTLAYASSPTTTRTTAMASPAFRQPREPSSPSTGSGLSGT